MVNLMDVTVSRDRCVDDVRGWLEKFTREPNAQNMQMVAHWAQQWLRLNAECAIISADKP